MNTRSYRMSSVQNGQPMFSKLSTNSRYALNYVLLIDSFVLRLTRYRRLRLDFCDFTVLENAEIFGLNSLPCIASSSALTQEQTTGNDGTPKRLDAWQTHSNQFGFCLSASSTYRMIVIGPLIKIKIYFHFIRIASPVSFKIDCL